MSPFILILWMFHGPSTALETREPISFQTLQFSDRVACQRALDTMLGKNRPDVRYSFDGVCVPQNTAPPKKRVY